MIGATFVTLGALEIGTLIAYALFGVATTQTYIYFSRFPKDSRTLKALVMFLFAAEIGHTVCITHTLYLYTIVQYGQNLQHLVTDPISKSLGATTFFTGILAATVQSCFAWCIYTLSHRLLVPCICWFLAFLRVVIAVIVLVIGAIHVSIEVIDTKWAFIHPLVWGESAANDFILAMTLVYWLYRQRSVDHHKTVTLVDTLIRWTIETGVVTATADLVTLICSVTMKKNLIWLAWYVIAAKLFSNALLASLNSRETLRTKDSNITLELSVPTGPDRSNEFRARAGLGTETKDEGTTYESSEGFATRSAKYS